MDLAPGFSKWPNQGKASMRAANGGEAASTCRAPNSPPHSDKRGAYADSGTQVCSEQDAKLRDWKVTADAARGYL